jgi:hypothetical protein
MMDKQLITESIARVVAASPRFAALDGIEVRFVDNLDPYSPLRLREDSFVLEVADDMSEDYRAETLDYLVAIMAVRHDEIGQRGDRDQRIWNMAGCIRAAAVVGAENIGDPLASSFYLDGLDPAKSVAEVYDDLLIGMVGGEIMVNIVGIGEYGIALDAIPVESDDIHSTEQLAADRARIAAERA